MGTKYCTEHPYIIGDDVEVVPLSAKNVILVGNVKVATIMCWRIKRLQKARSAMSTHAKSAWVKSNRLGTRLCGHILKVHFEFFSNCAQSIRLRPEFHLRAKP